MAISLRARGMGEILDGAFRLYKQDIGLYVLTAVLAGLPLAVGIVFTVVAGVDSVVASLVGVALILVGFLGYMLLGPLLLHEMNERLEGREPLLGPAFHRVTGMIFRVLWAYIITFVIVVGAMFALSFVAFGGGALVTMVSTDTVGIIFSVVVSAAIVLTIGVRIFAASKLFLPAMIVEDATGFGAVTRGYTLTSKGSYRIAAVVGLASILIFVPVFAIYFFFGLYTVMTDPAAAGTVSTSQAVIQQLISLIGYAITTPFLVACGMLLYYDQRVRLEAFDLEAEAGTLVD